MNKSLGALNTIHRRRDLLAGVYLGAVVIAVIVRLQLTETRLYVLIAEITRMSQYSCSTGKYRIDVIPYVITFDRNTLNLLRMARKGTSDLFL